MIDRKDDLIKAIVDGIKEQTDIAVLGMSGGADSTLVAILCTMALGKENVYSLHMPYDSIDHENSNSKSKLIAEKLGVNIKFVCIDEAVDRLSREISGMSRLNMGNMRSRMRMVALYSMSCRVAEETGKRVRVIGTGNLSEDWIGYDTKGGDALADFFPIGTLVKSEVYQLLESFRDEGIITEDMIDRVPSAGLWEGQTDEDELGYTYDEMEPWVLRMQHGAVDLSNPVCKFVYDRWKNNKHKHEAPLVFQLREFCK